MKKKRLWQDILRILSGNTSYMNETFVSAVLTFTDGSTVTVVPQGAPAESTVSVTDTGITVTKSDGTSQDFVPAS